MRTILSLLLCTWEIGATAYGYSVPDQRDFVMLVAPADIQWFHLEGRYNYEGLDTGSMFLGLNAGAGDQLRLDATAMVGAVFGDFAGIAPGLRVTLSWSKLDLSTENELVVDLSDPGASFFYSWSELGLSPWPWLRVGAVAQRTRVARSELEIQRGLFASVTLFQTVTLAFYELNLGWATPTYIAAIGASY